jgi:death-on-curing protein
MKKPHPEFLTLAEVIAIHNNQIENYGGKSGIRDLSLLNSAVAVPQSTFDRKYLHEDLFDMAAAYAYHICQNHPFIDGNKRVALVSALVFLDLNNIDINDPHNILYNAMIDIASGNISKKDLASIFRKLSK